MPDYDNPEIEASWFAERRLELTNYLAGESFSNTKIREQPAWYIAPYVSIWAIENNETPGLIKWWAISGDLPNDYVSASLAQNPREAMKAIASLWEEASQYMARGELHPTFIIGNGEASEELAPMLASRAKMLLEWANDQEIWTN